MSDLKNQPDIKLVKLYSEYVEDTKLTKYHFSGNNVVFFFLFRYLNPFVTACGVHFFMIIS